MGISNKAAARVMSKRIAGRDDKTHRHHCLGRRSIGELAAAASCVWGVASRKWPSRGLGKARDRFQCVVEWRRRLGVRWSGAIVVAPHQIRRASSEGSLLSLYPLATVARSAWATTAGARARCEGGRKGRGPSGVGNRWLAGWASQTCRAACRAFISWPGGRAGE